LLFCECLLGHFPDYLRERPSPERLVEAVLRMEEIFTGAEEVPVVPSGALVEVGPALDVRAFSAERRAGASGDDPLLRQLAASIQGQLDRLLAEGPPPAWRWASPAGKNVASGAGISGNAQKGY
jgi:hypothetical protein